MYFYKEVKNGDLMSLQTGCNLVESSDTFVLITEEEYENLSAFLREKGKRELQEEIEKSKSEEIRYIEQLEKENAALLYQILTGEALDDV